MILLIRIFWFGLLQIFGLLKLFVKVVLHELLWAWNDNSRWSLLSTPVLIFTAQTRNFNEVSYYNLKCFFWVEFPG